MLAHGKKTLQRILSGQPKKEESIMQLVMKALSFNTNHSNFKGILLKLREDYKQVKFNNMRLNEMAHDYDQWKMMAFLGQSHFAAPIEGISNRVRNGLMNKNLDREAVDFIFDQMIGQSVSDIKVGGYSPATSGKKIG